MEKFKKLSSEEARKVDGGGWIADAVGWFVGGLVCNCDNGAGEGARGYGGVLGMNMYSAY